MKRDDAFYMGLALQQARLAAELGEIPIGAVIVLDDEVIAAASNRRETGYDATAHAEVLAIREACAKLQSWRLQKATLYVTVEPCTMCAGAIVIARIERVVYGCPDSKAGGVESLYNILTNKLLNHQVSVRAGVREEECAAVLKEFFARRREAVKE